MRYILLIVIFLLSSCSSSEETINIPNNIIGQEKMKEIYIDIHISDAMVAKKKLKEVKLSNQLKKSYFEEILAKHHISKEEFEKSNAFYEKNIDLMYKMYEEIMVSLSAKQAELEGVKKNLEKEKD